MKKRITLVLFLALAACSDSSDSHSTRYDEWWSIVIDNTDSLHGEQIIDQFLDALQLNEDPWKGVGVVFSTIDEIDQTKGKTFVLASGNEQAGIKIRRKQEVKRFEQQVRSYFLELMSIDSATKKSILYRTLQQELHELKEAQAGSKRMIVLSDLFENAEISFYDNQTRELLVSNPKRVESELNKYAGFDDFSLKGIRISFVYKPKSYEENMRHRMVSNFFKDVFTERGAKVESGLKQE